MIRHVLVMIITLIYSDIIDCVLSSQHGRHYMCFRLRGIDLVPRHGLDPENLLTRSLKVKLFQIIT